jgi:uncharacterized phage protein gp47/JayE
LLSLLTLTTLVQRFAASAQARATALLDFTVGSVERALAEANASIVLWLQWLIVLVLRATRAATSQGADLDSWMADFTLARLPATVATGSVTFARFTATVTALIPVGAQVKTGDGAQTFTVTLDTGNALWNAAFSGYLVPVGQVSATVPVAAQAPGAAGNVQAGAISLLASAMPGIDTVTNAAPLANGFDAETDDLFRARFAAFIQSRSRATKLAVQAAIQSVQQGLQFTILENTASDGSYQLGNFVVTVDDGSGSPSSGLLAAVQTAVDAVRPIGSTFMVQGPADVTVTIALTIATMPAASKAGLLGPVQQAVLAFVDALPVGAPLPYSRIAAVAYAVDPAITNVSAVTVNGGTADITASQVQVIKAASVVVS